MTPPDARLSPSPQPPGLLRPSGATGPVPAPAAHLPRPPGRGRWPAAGPVAAFAVLLVVLFCAAFAAGRQAGPVAPNLRPSPGVVHDEHGDDGGGNGDEHGGTSGMEGM